LQYIQSRQSRKLELAELGFNAMDEEPENIKLKKLMVRCIHHILL
jgi:hypothetical protein